MKIAILSNINSRGLEWDARIVEDIVSRAGHEPTVLQYTKAHGGRFDLAIFLEVGPRWAMALAPRRWWFPNAEWFNQAIEPAEFDLILCKTRDAAHRVSDFLKASKISETRCLFVGFSSRDRLLGEVPRERRFLHAPGKSVVKGTRAVLGAWARFKIDCELVMVGPMESRMGTIHNVRRLPWLSDHDIQIQQNAALWHLCPSEYEGFGHCIHEALSCGAIVARTSHPPMSESPGVPIGAKPTKRMGIATLFQASPYDVRDAVEECLSMDDLTIRRARNESRDHFEDMRAYFERRMSALLKDA